MDPFAALLKTDFDKIKADGHSPQVEASQVFHRPC